MLLCQFLFPSTIKENQSAVVANLDHVIQHGESILRIFYAFYSTLGYLYNSVMMIYFVALVNDNYTEMADMHLA